MTLTDHPVTDTSTGSTDTSELTAIVPDGPDEQAAGGPLGGVPGLVGLPVVVAGGAGLALTDLGAFSGGAGTATLTILLGCTVVGLAVATVWAAALGDSVSASLYAIFGGFYASDIALTAGLAHGWFGPADTGGTAATQAWLTCWLILFVLLTPLCLRLPAITTIMLVLVDVAVVLLLLASITDSTLLLRLGGLGVAGFVATVAWQYADLMLVATGGKGLPMGKPLVS